jgi:hypothetical protein
MGGHSSQLKRRLARWWDAVSHHPLWAALIAALLAGGIAAHSDGVFGGDSTPDTHGATRKPTDTKSQAHPLRVAFDQVAPVIYSVAFSSPTGLPSQSEEWASLHRRGAVDVGQSNFRLTLANQTSAPLTVTNIEAVVYGSKSAPTGTVASVFTQGSGTLEEFSVELASNAKGATAQFHRQEPTELPTESPSIAPAFFHSHYIRVPPHDIYEAAVSVITTVYGQVEYSFVVTGATASSGFSYHLAPRFAIARYESQSEFARSYWWLPKTSSGGPCWIAQYAPSDGQQPRCG